VCHARGAVLAATLPGMADSGSTYTVERSTTIAAPAARIYDQIADFHNWTQWSPWEDVDPALTREYSGAGAGTGAVYTWKGNRKAGEGRMEIVDAVPSERVEVDLRFVKPFKSRSTTSFVLTPAGDATRVTWTLSGPNTPMLKVMGLFRSMDKLIGPDFDKGLSRLKTYAEGRG
jgi:uncharacterized protein YndB with AHSA1/START domain